LSVQGIRLSSHATTGFLSAAYLAANFKKRLLIVWVVPSTGAYPYEARFTGEAKGGIMSFTEQQLLRTKQHTTNKINLFDRAI
jgi:hypothetical protein